jgi:hypothetical protein
MVLRRPVETKLAALIAVVHDIGRCPYRDGHGEGVKDQTRSQVRGHRPSDDRRDQASSTTARNRKPAAVGT